MLEFLVPIVHPDKPTRVTITIGNTLFGALDGRREVDWGVVFRDLAQRLTKGVGKPKPTPICPFLFHLYDGQGLLTSDEELNYRTAKDMAGYRITPDPDLQPKMDEDEPVPTPAPSPRLGPSRTPKRRRKSLTGRHQGHLLSSPGDFQVRFHRNRSQGLSNLPVDRIPNRRGRDRRKDGNGWRNPLLTWRGTSGRPGFNTNPWRRRWSRSALSER